MRTQAEEVHLLRGNIGSQRVWKWIQYLDPQLRTDPTSYFNLFPCLPSSRSRPWSWSQSFKPNVDFIQLNLADRIDSCSNPERLWIIGPKFGPVQVRIYMDSPWSCDSPRPAGNRCPLREMPMDMGQRSHNHAGTETDQGDGNPLIRSKGAVCCRSPPGPAPSPFFFGYHLSGRVS